MKEKRLVTIKGTDMYGNEVTETVDLNQTFEEMLKEATGRDIPVTYIVLKREDDK